MELLLEPGSTSSWAISSRYLLVRWRIRPLSLNVDDLDRTPFCRCPDAPSQFIRYLAYSRVAIDPICLDDPARTIHLVFLEHLRTVKRAGAARNAFLSFDLYSHWVDLLYDKQTALDATRAAQPCSNLVEQLQ